MQKFIVDTFIGEKIEVGGVRQESLASGWSRVVSGGLDSSSDNMEHHLDKFSLVSGSLDARCIKNGWDCPIVKNATLQHFARLEEAINGALDRR